MIKEKQEYDKVVKEQNKAKQKKSLFKKLFSKISDDDEEEMSEHK